MSCLLGRLEELDPNLSSGEALSCQPLLHLLQECPGLLSPRRGPLGSEAEVHWLWPNVLSADDLQSGGGSISRFEMQKSFLP